MYATPLIFLVCCVSVKAKKLDKSTQHNLTHLLRCYNTGHAWCTYTLGGGGHLETVFFRRYPTWRELSICTHASPKSLVGEKKSEPKNKTRCEPPRGLLYREIYTTLSTATIEGDTHFFSEVFERHNFGSLRPLPKNDFGWRKIKLLWVCTGGEAPWPQGTPRANHAKRKMTAISDNLKLGQESFYDSPPPTFLERNRRFQNQLPVVSPKIQRPSILRRHRSIDLVQKKLYGYFSFNRILPCIEQPRSVR